MASFYGKFASADNRCLVIDDGGLISFAPAGLTTYTIPDSVTSINAGTFQDCSSLISVYIPESVTFIGAHAFQGCSSLISVTVSDGVPWIGSCTFDSCDSLTSVTIPNSVTSIGDTAFMYCSNLTSITIPNSVTSIGNYAFELCDSLASVYCKATTPPTLGEDNNVFTDNAPNRKIYVPSASVDAYKTADGWKDYADSIFADPTEN